MERTGFFNTAKLGLAYDFYRVDSGERFTYSPNRLEGVGRALTFLQGTSLHHLFRQITNPMVVAGLTLAAWGAVSIAIYPTQTYALLTKIVPLTRHIQSWHLKAALYWAINATIVGIGLRAIGRYRNPELVRAYQAGELQAVRLGYRRD